MLTVFGCLTALATKEVEACPSYRIDLGLVTQPLMINFLCFHGIAFHLWKKYFDYFQDAYRLQGFLQRLFTVSLCGILVLLVEMILFTIYCGKDATTTTSLVLYWIHTGLSSLIAIIIIVAIIVKVYQDGFAERNHLTPSRAKEISRELAILKSCSELLKKGQIQAALAKIESLQTNQNGSYSFMTSKYEVAVKLLLQIRATRITRSEAFQLTSNRTKCSVCESHFEANEVVYIRPTVKEMLHADCSIKSKISKLWEEDRMSITALEFDISELVKTAKFENGILKPISPTLKEMCLRGPLEVDYSVIGKRRFPEYNDFRYFARPLPPRVVQLLDPIEIDDREFRLMERMNRFPRERLEMRPPRDEKARAVINEEAPPVANANEEARNEGDAPLSESDEEPQSSPRIKNL